VKKAAAVGSPILLKFQQKSLPIKFSLSPAQIQRRFKDFQEGGAFLITGEIFTAPVKIFLM
jgi:hypothetical protein